MKEIKINYNCVSFSELFSFFYDISGGYIMTHIECKWDHALNIVIRYSGEILFPFIVLLF